MDKPASEPRGLASGNPVDSETVPVWDWPLRLWHWTLALLVLIAWFTPNHYDSLHRVAGYGVIGLLVFRIVWGFVGTRHSRFRNLGPRLRAAPTFLRDLGRGRAPAAISASTRPARRC
jgi:cytochrome b